jgi:hypothetical protein
MPGLSACFLGNLKLLVYCLRVVLFPVILFVTVSLLKIPFSSDVLLMQNHPGEITFHITAKASCLLYGPQHPERNVSPE